MFIKKKIKTNAIKVSWGRGQQDVVENIFGYTISAAKIDLLHNKAFK